MRLALKETFLLLSIFGRIDLSLHAGSRNALVTVVAT